MPTYQYLCRDCENRFDTVQSIHDDALTVCPECGGTIRRVLHPVGVTFKGSGFYRTDSREKQKAGSTSSASAGTSSGESGGAGKDAAASSGKGSESAGGSSSTSKGADAKPSSATTTGAKKETKS